MCLVAATLALVATAASDKQPSNEELLNHLSSPSPQIRMEAARILTGHPRHPERFIPLLIEAMEDERPGGKIPFGIPAEPWRVADQAERALVSFGADAVPAVTEILGHPETKVRSRAAQVLENIGKAAASSAPRLAIALSREKDSRTRHCLLSAIGVVENDSSRLARVLLEALDSDSPDECALAMRICGRRNLRDGVIIARLIAALDDPRSRWESWSPDTAFPVPVQRDAAEALGRIGPAAAAAELRLRKIMETHSDAGTRVTAAYAVFRIAGEDQPALDVLIEMAGQREQSLLAASDAVRFIGQLGPKAASALPVLARSTIYRSEEELGFDSLLRSEALLAVAKVGGVNSLHTLTRALGSADASDREAAANAISTLGRGAYDAVPELIQAAQDERDALSLSARYAAIEALGAIGPDAREAIPILTKIVAENSAPGQEELAEAAKESLTKIDLP